MVYARRNKSCCHSYRPACYCIAHASHIAFLLVVVILPYVAANWNPYEVLGVQHGASLNQIKKAYRESARKLHPDKQGTQNEDGTSQRFIELNKAFNILKDPDKRSRFDQYGDTNENRFSTRNSRYNRHNDAREHWSPDGFRTFTFSSSESVLRKKTITAKQYYGKYLKESKYKPFIIFFYADFCPTCTMIESTWSRITDELAHYNFGSFTIHVYLESRLALDLGVDSIPYIAFLVDEKATQYPLTELSLKSLVKFVKTLLPYNLIAVTQSEHEQDRFVNNAIVNNRLAVVIFDAEKSIKLRYSLLAFELRQYFQFSHISTKSSDHSAFAKRFGLSAGETSAMMLVFNEDISQPALTIRLTPHESYSHIRQRLIEWPFLKLPRISSQDRFDDLCHYAVPKEGEKSQMRVCSLLFVRSSSSSLLARMKMIEFSEMNHFAKNSRIMFAYVDPVKQTEFVKSLSAETREAQPNFLQESIENAVILIERHPQHNRKARYKWINSRWDPNRPSELERAKIELHQHIDAYLHHNFEFPNKMALNIFIDEEGSCLLERMYKRLYEYTIRILQFLVTRETFLAVAVLMSCACMTLLYKSPVDIPFNQENAPKDERKHTRQENKQFSSEHQSTRADGITSDDNLKILELCAETYNGMIRLLKPGYRSIILLTDREAFDTLIPKFKESVWPYRRNKTLLFGYLDLDKNLDWYRSLLEAILGTEGLRVNKKNCIGTVLSLNGFKKYLRVYHAKHHEGNDSFYNDEVNDNGSFLGLDENDSVTSDIEQPLVSGANFQEHDICEVEHLLDRLSIWLDKMFDGLTKRYFLDRWPEETMK